MSEGEINLKNYEVNPGIRLKRNYLMESASLIRIGLFLISFFFISCGPLTKEAYLEDYAEFIQGVTERSSEFREKEWAEVEQDYNKFSVEWREKFQQELTLTEKMTLTRYEVQFNVIRVKVFSAGFMDLLE